MYRRGVPHGGRGQRQEGQQEEGGGADAGQAEAAPAGGECHGAQAPQDGDDQEEEQEDCSATKCLRPTGKEVSCNFNIFGHGIRQAFFGRPKKKLKGKKLKL